MTDKIICDIIRYHQMLEVVQRESVGNYVIADNIKRLGIVEAFNHILSCREAVLEYINSVQNHEE